MEEKERGGRRRGERRGGGEGERGWRRGGDNGKIEKGEHFFFLTFIIPGRANGSFKSSKFLYNFAASILYSVHTVVIFSLMRVKFPKITIF